MRVITFQSGEVLNILVRDGEYYADISKCRESNGYEHELKILDGKCPIWVFTNPDIETGLTYTTPECWRCEMSLDHYTGLKAFVAMEFDLSPSNLFTGVSHNAYKYAMVTDHLSLSDLCCTYTIADIVVDDSDWYFKKFTVSNVFNGKVPALTKEFRIGSSWSMWDAVCERESDALAHGLKKINFE